MKYGDAEFELTLQALREIHDMLAVAPGALVLSFRESHVEGRPALILRFASANDNETDSYLVLPMGVVQL